MTQIKIALLQIAPCKTLEENLEKEWDTAGKPEKEALISHYFPKCGVTDTGFMAGLLRNGKRKPFRLTAALSTHLAALPGNWIWPLALPCLKNMKRPPQFACPF